MFNVTRTVHIEMKMILTPRIGLMKYGLCGQHFLDNDPIIAALKREWPLLVQILCAFWTVCLLPAELSTNNVNYVNTYYFEHKNLLHPIMFLSFLCILHFLREINRGYYFWSAPGNIFCCVNRYGNNPVCVYRKHACHKITYTKYTSLADFPIVS